jgi:NAD(P)H-dependent FMN reductase
MDNTDESKLRILTLLGSSREGRKGDAVANWVMGQIRADERFSVDFVDSRMLELPFFDEVDSPASLDGNFKSQAAKAWSDRLAKADGFVIITPEYNHGLPAVLKNAIDYAWEGWHYKPVSIVSYSDGPYGGARATEQLRLVLAGVRALPLPRALHVPRVQDAFDEADGSLRQDWIATSFAGVLGELSDIAQRLKR